MIVKPLVLIILGLNIRHKNNLPKKGPAIIVANHNSHLDTIVLMTLFPLKLLPKLRPVAAADYFLKNKIISWFALNVIGIIPIDRKKRVSADKVFKNITDAIDNKDIIILYPEGSRGEPEKLEHFKTGTAHLAEMRKEVPITPVFLHGLGKALPKGDWVLVPFFCDVFIGKSLKYTQCKKSFMHDLDLQMEIFNKEFNSSIDEEDNYSGAE